MNKEVERYARNTLAKPDSTLARESGGALVKTGVAGLAVWGTAGLLPFVTFPMLLIAMVILGGMLWMKNGD